MIERTIKLTTPNTDNAATFRYVDTDDDGALDTVLHLSPRQYEELGRPTLLAMTIEPHADAELQEPVRELSWER